MTLKHIILYADGASRGNPGTAGAGAILKSPSGEVLAEIAQYLGEKLTNNYAEYQALIIGLTKALELDAKLIDVFMDSELVVKQINGIYKVKHENMIPLYQQAMSLLKKFKQYHVKHVRREYNKEADRLSNLAIDGREN